MTKKPHKTRKQIQAEKLAASTKLVAKANSIIDPFENLTHFHKFKTKDGQEVELTVKRVKDVSSETMNCIFNLMEKNMKKLYEESWGWNFDAKKAELTEEKACYLIATCQDRFIGFSHFRFDLDDNIEVLYCYEIQLEPNERQKGLGSFMMQALESMAASNKMQKIVLTVLKKNPLALQFFYKQGFKVDITNPPASEAVDYIILSKQKLQKISESKSNS